MVKKRGDIGYGQAGKKSDGRCLHNLEKTSEYLGQVLDTSMVSTDVSTIMSGRVYEGAAHVPVFVLNDFSSSRFSDDLNETTGRRRLDIINGE